MTRCARFRARRVASLLLVGALAACGADKPDPVTPDPPRTPGLAVSLTVVSGDAQVASVGEFLPAPVRLVARDSAGLPVPGLRVGAGVMEPAYLAVPVTHTDSQGIAAINFELDNTLGRRQFKAFLIEGSGPVRVLEAEFSVVARAAAPARMEVSFPSGYPCCAYIGRIVSAPVFAVRDRFGNPVDGVLVSFQPEPGDSIEVTTRATDSAGKASPGLWKIGGERGVHQLVATAGATTATATVEVTTGPPAAIAVSGGNGQLVAPGAAVSGPIRVRVSDSEGRGVYFIPVVWSDEASGTTLCTSGTDIGGEASFARNTTCEWRPGAQPGPYTIKATVGNLVARATATVIASPTGLEVVSGPPSDAAYATGTSPQSDIVFSVRFPNGLPVAGAWIDATVSPEDFTGTWRDSAITDADGIARLRWRLPRMLGVYTLTATLRAFPDLRRTFIARVFGVPPFSSIGAGLAHTCGSMRLSTTTDAPPILCWGRNAEGQLGDGTKTGRTSPGVALVNLSSAETGPPAAGRGHTCAEFDRRYPSTGAPLYPFQLQCWGADEAGQAGADARPSVGPVEITPALTRPAAGASHTCGIGVETYQVIPSSSATGIRTNAVWCWGDNRFGQLGDGTTTGRARPALVDSAAFGSRPGSIGAGDDFTCAVVESGRAFCWGRNTDGQLGDGTTTDRTRPVAVSGGLLFSSIAVGARHACALSRERVAYCWGRNNAGQLGDGSPVSSAAPVAVLGGLTFTSLAAGGSHTCGLTATGSVYCWGANTYGQLGAASFAGGFNQPTPVAGGLSFTKIVAGAAHTCALVAPVFVGPAYCWGLNAEGQLGDGTTTNRLQPTPVVEFRP